MVLHLSLRDSKYPQVSMILLRILVDPNNDVVKLAPIRPLICSYFSPLTNPLRSLLSAPNKIGITVTLIFHSFLDLWQCLSSCLTFNYVLVSPCVTLEQKNSLDNKFSRYVFFFLLNNTRCYLLVGIRWSFFISKFQRILWLSFFRRDSRLCILHF